MYFTFSCPDALAKWIIFKCPYKTTWKGTDRLLVRTVWTRAGVNPITDFNTTTHRWHEVHCGINWTGGSSWGAIRLHLAVRPPFEKRITSGNGLHKCHYSILDTEMYPFLYCVHHWVDCLRVVVTMQTAGENLKRSYNHLTDLLWSCRRWLQRASNFHTLRPSLWGHTGSSYRLIDVPSIWRRGSSLQRWGMRMFTGLGD